MIVQALKEALKPLFNALKSSGEDKLLVDISEDDVGIAKDATLSDVLTKITDLANALKSVDTDKLLVDIADQEILVGVDSQNHWAEAVTLLASGARTAKWNWE